ncbi:YkvA family protein [Cellulomonas massiliensis]|uniref:YkvA family protein n=1 Tax=Cellulomonas massiliensis TaxID=1465811 RepID=UPI0003760CB3|nr:DUF1232 domain-containing protein [Cellulomonas massiliensis]
MDAWWQPVAAVAAGLLLVWALLVVALLVAARRTADPVTLREALRLLPDVVRLVRRLAADPALPRGVRWRLWLLLGYLLLPFDLVPDVLPVVGYADDAVVVALVLRSVVRRAGAGALERHWPGTPQGMAVLRRLCGLGPPPAAG